MERHSVVDPSGEDNRATPLYPLEKQLGQGVVLPTTNCWIHELIKKS